jgi:hypothetical protein
LDEFVENFELLARVRLGVRVSLDVSKRNADRILVDPSASFGWRDLRGYVESLLVVGHTMKDEGYRSVRGLGLGTIALIARNDVMIAQAYAPEMVDARTGSGPRGGVKNEQRRSIAAVFVLEP